jgi:hypothetical protein
VFSLSPLDGERNASMRLDSMTLPFWIENEMPERKRMVVTATPIRLDPRRGRLCRFRLFPLGGALACSLSLPWIMINSGMRLDSMTLPFWIENEMPERKRMVVTATPIRVDEIRVCVCVCSYAVFQIFHLSSRPQMYTGGLLSHVFRRTSARRLY